MLDELNTLELSLQNRHTTVRAARWLNIGSALLATSVLLDSAVEHYRGSFKNSAMYTPLVVSSLSLVMNAHGTTDRDPEIHRARQAVSVATALTGMAGLSFHLYNVLKRPGRLAWQNLFYGAPLGAPVAILLAGLLGTAAEQVRDNPRHEGPPRSGPAGRSGAGRAQRAWHARHQR